MPTVAAPPGTRACPKCSHENPIAEQECSHCHVLIDKALRAETRAKQDREADSEGWLYQLGSSTRLAVKQQVEGLEAWTGIETANSYVIRDETSNFVLHADEKSGSIGGFLMRNWLEALRPFTIDVATPVGETVLVLERPFRFFFAELEVFDAFGKPLGKVQREFAWLNSRYRVSGRRPGETYQIHGPIFRPWTFKILKHGRECGLITKRWSGLRKEIFTDADSFGIEFPGDVSPALKAVFLGAVFLIDFMHFEDNN